MKKVWTIVAGLIILAATVLLAIFIVKPIYEKRFVFDRIKYNNREYNLSHIDPMALSDLTGDAHGDPIDATGVFYYEREIYVSLPVGWQYDPTVIFLKHKNVELFDTYELVGGP